VSAISSFYAFRPEVLALGVSSIHACVNQIHYIHRQSQRQQMSMFVGGKQGLRIDHLNPLRQSAQEC
jgi:hypothetical protein